MSLISITTDPTIVTSTITALPTEAVTASCPLQVLGLPDNIEGVNIIPLNNQTFGYLTMCCKGAPIVEYQLGCSAYCEPKGQTVDDLLDCLAPKDSTGTRHALEGISGYTSNEQQDNVGTNTTSSSTMATSSTLSTPQATSSHTSGVGRVTITSSLLLMSYLTTLVLA